MAEPNQAPWIRSHFIFHILFFFSRFFPVYISRTGAMRARVVSSLLAAVRRVATGELVCAALQSEHFSPCSPLGPANGLEPLATVWLRERRVHDGQG